MRTFIFEVAHGGLGDHLFFSHLPRIAKTSGGFSKVYLSNRSVFRNSEYRKLIWELNPYVDGFCDETLTPVQPVQWDASMNILDRVMLERGLDDGQRFHEPEIFYRPVVKADLLPRRVYDPNYISNVGAMSTTRLRHAISRLGGVDCQMRILNKAFGAQPGLPELAAKDIFDYCDIIASCASFFCLTSGGATLAAAINKPAVCFFGFGVNPIFHHSSLHRYVDVSVPLASVMPALRRAVAAELHAGRRRAS